MKKYNLICPIRKINPIKAMIKANQANRTYSNIVDRNLVVVPSYVSKGLEFDSVIIYTEKDNKYTDDEKYLYYVSCTRCQHELVIYNQED